MLWWLFIDAKADGGHEIVFETDGAGADTLSRALWIEVDAGRLSEFDLRRVEHGRVLDESINDLPRLVDSTAALAWAKDLAKR